MTAAEIAELGPEVPDWQLLERDGIARVERVFNFPNFADAPVDPHASGLVLSAAP